MKTRYDLINYLIKKFKYKSYLEIGVQYGHTWNTIECLHKTGVEPEFTHVDDRIYKLKSDKFFELNTSFFDLIFVDGDHSFEQSKRDIMHAFLVLNPKGRIVCHDVLPKDQEHTNPYLCGEVYRSIAHVLTLGIFDINTWVEDHGCGILKRGSTEIDIKINNYEDYEKHKDIYKIFSDINGRASSL